VSVDCKKSFREGHAETSFTKNTTLSLSAEEEKKKKKK
jgi:hypothetical protein|tara:strand:- start:446 stop:559 length:114 start_codon:yes stop_codon:yes gene_type:complete